MSMREEIKAGDYCVILEEVEDNAIPVGSIRKAIYVDHERGECLFECNTGWLAFHKKIKEWGLKKGKRYWWVYLSGVEKVKTVEGW